MATETRKIQITWEDGMWSERQTCNYGDSIEERGNPPIGDESNFLGWFTRQNGGEKVVFPFTAEHDVTIFGHRNEDRGHNVTAMQDERKYTVKVSYIDASGSEKELWQKEVPHGSTIKSLGIPEWIGHEFIGWYTNDNQPYPNKFKITSDITIYAHWDLIKYPLKLELGGIGSIIHPYPSEYTVNEWEHLTIPTPSYDANRYVFDGWDPEKLPNNTIGEFTFTAKWSKRQYTVDLDATGGKFDDDSALKSWTKEYQQCISDDPLPIPTKDGHEFLGWKIDGKPDSDHVSNTDLVESDLSLVADWKTNTYEVTFHYRSGDRSDYTREFHEKDWHTSLFADFPSGRPPYVQGYEFIGWYTKLNDGVEISTDATVCSNMDVWAIYVGGYTVTFDGNGGAFDCVKLAFGPQSRIKDQKLNPKRTGYTFNDWVDSTGQSVSQNTVQSDMRVFASWEDDPITVTLHGNGGIWNSSDDEDGSGYEPKLEYVQTPLKGVPFVIDRNPFEKVGHRFVGWTDEEGSNQSKQDYGVFYEDEEDYIPPISFTDNEDLYAVWDRIMLSFTFDPSGGKFGDGSEDVHSINDIPYGQFIQVDQQILNPTRSGYVFNGWYDKSGGEHIQNWAFYATRNLDLIAKWTADGGVPQADIPQEPKTPDVPSSVEYNVISPNADAGNKFTIVGSSNPCAKTIICTKWYGPSSGGLLHSCSNIVQQCNPYTISNQTTFLYECTQFKGEYYYKVDILPGADIANKSSLVVGSASRPVWNRRGYKFRGWVLKDSFGNSIPEQPGMVSGKTYYYTTQEKKLSVYINRRYAHMIDTSVGQRIGFSFYASTQKI